MKKNSIGSRIISLLLALVMVLSMVPTGVFAASVGDLYTGDTGIKTDTLGDEGYIYWPMKIYDYLNDGILFESAQQYLTDSDVSRLDNYYYDIKYNYGGGSPAPIIEEGTDLTGNAWYGSDTAPWRTIGVTHRFNWQKISPDDYDRATATTDDDPFINPRFLRITRDMSATSGKYRFCLKNFQTTTNRRDTAYLKLSSMRYMVLTYRSEGFTNEDDVGIWLQYKNSSGDSVALKCPVQLEDQEGWNSMVIDFKAIMGSTDWSTYESTKILAAHLYMPTLEAEDQVDISHVAFFDTKTEAEQFGIDAEDFSNNPGELLKLNPTITTNSGTKTKLPLVEQPGYVITVNQQYTEGRNTITDPGTYYGLNLTTKENIDGNYVNGYATNSFNSWKQATTISMPYVNKTMTETMTKMTVTEMQEEQGQRYVRLSNNSGNTGRNRIILTKFWEDHEDADAPQMKNARYAVLVYRTHGLTTKNKYGFWAQGNNGSGTAYVTGLTAASSWTSDGVNQGYNFKVSEDLWTYVIVDLYDAMDEDSDMALMYNSGKGRLKRVGMYLPPLVDGKSLDLAYVAYFDNETVAEYFGSDATGYMNGGKTVDAEKVTVTLSDRYWSGGNNLAFGMLYSSQGGGWSNGIYGGSSSNTSGGYDSWRVGYDLLNGYSFASNTTRQNIYGKPFTAYYTESDSKTAATPADGKTTNNIFYVNSKSDDGNSSNGGYDMSKLDLDGYQLLTTLTQGGMTAGLLEGTLENGMPVYRQEAVEYIAMVLYRTLPIPQFDADGDYNYTFLMGAANSALGGFDLNGDGVIGRADLNGDNYAETDEARLDLPTALRGCLGIRFTLGQQRGTNPAMGSYNQTVKKNLIGEFKDVRNNITTCMDAAYFLLNTLFYDNSYNQLQDDYSYLKLDNATMDNGKNAYVFDAGYSTGSTYAEGTVISGDSDYEKQSQSAINYDPLARVDSNGNVISGEGIISMKDVNSKDLFYYTSSHTTTRFPFLPVTDSEGDFAGPTKTPYFVDDGVPSLTLDKSTYAERNFNYAMACNGEFVYHEDDGLFFEFEGDDDVYLFINGQLVLDLGGAHSITNESFEVNKYVDWARAIVAAVKAKDGDYEAAGYTAETYERALKLDLTEGEICQFDFYYMERHGYGAAGL